MKSLDEIIIYKDDNIVILNKPSFLLSQKDGTGEVSLEDYVQEYFHNRNARLINLRLNISMKFFLITKEWRRNI